MRTLLLGCLSLLALASTSDAQIFAVHLNGPKAEKKFKKSLVEYNGQMVLIGEPKSGFVYSPEKNNLSYINNANNELFIVDPDKPEEYAYFLVDGKKEANSKKNRIIIHGKYIERLSIVMRDQSLPGLTTEYNIRTAQIDDYREARDKEEKGSVAYLAAHHRLLTSLERLENWLANVGFPGAQKDIAKDLKKEVKAVRDAALQARYDKAVASIQPDDPPEQYQELSQEISGGKDVFHGYKSLHCRLYYLTETARPDQQVISDAQAKHLLEKAEEIIEGFRAEFVDPYLSEDFPEYIPDDLMITWGFFPNNIKDINKYGQPLYSASIQEGSQIKGSGNVGGLPSHWRYIWRLEDPDLEGIICHQLGHVLSNAHYGQGRTNLHQAWLSEAVGNQLSYEFLGRNNVTCLGLREKPTYEKREASEPGKKTIAFGRRATYNALALEQGSPINQIALKKLHELADGDLAKGWSFYDYIARKEGIEGQMWLRAAGEHAPKRDTFIEKWREAAAEVLGVKAGNAFRTLEDRWRKYAENEQLDDKARKKKR